MTEIKEGYTRVSEIISPFSGYDKIDPAILKKAADRGTRIHNYCFEHIAGLTPFFLKDSDLQYFTSFMIWYNNLPVVAESRYYDDDLMITGEIDIIVPDPGNGYKIVDLKTSSSPNKCWKAQGGGYAYLLEKNWNTKVTAIEFVHLQKDGRKPIIHSFDVQESIDLFKACEKVYTHFYKK